MEYAVCGECGSVEEVVVDYDQRKTIVQCEECGYKEVMDLPEVEEEPVSEQPWVAWECRPLRYADVE